MLSTTVLLDTATAVMDGPTAVAWLRTALLRHAPGSHARMTPAGYDAKYLREPAQIMDADLAAHLAGALTLATTLQRDGQGFLAACDIDAGGPAALRCVLAAAAARNLAAYGFALRSDTHDGGHVWIPFAEAHPSADLAALMRDILADAGVTRSEVYPSAADLRLPFGLHQRCGRRGQLLLAPDAAPIAIDPDPCAAVAALAAVWHPNGPTAVVQAAALQQARLQSDQASAAARRTHQLHAATPGYGRALTVIHQFNAATDLVELLTSYGGRVAHRYGGGRVLLHCAARNDHRNGDQHPSLVVHPGAGNQSGKTVCGCYSPACRLHNAPGQVLDAFEVFCILEGIDRREGVRRLSWRASATRSAGAQRQAAPRAATGYRDAGRPATAQAPCSAAVPTDTPVVVPPADDTPPANDWRVALETRAYALWRDPQVLPTTARLYQFLVECCHDGPRCRPSNAAIADALGVCVGTVKRLKRQLAQAGHIQVDISTDGHSTSVIHLVADTSDRGGVIDRSPDHELGIGSARKGGAITPRARPPRRQPTGADLTELSIEALRKRRHTLLATAHRSDNPAQRYTLSRQAAAVEQELARRQAVAAVAMFGATDDPAAAEQPAYVGPLPEVLDTVSNPPATLADPDAPHPAPDAHALTAALRAGLRARVFPQHRRLVERLGARAVGDTLVLCYERALAEPVQRQLLPLLPALLEELHLAARFTHLGLTIAPPAEAPDCPAWLDRTRWLVLPRRVREDLIGTAVVEGRLYGLTPQHTAALQVQRADFVVLGLLPADAPAPAAAGQAASPEGATAAALVPAQAPAGAVPPGDARDGQARAALPLQAPPAHTRNDAGAGLAAPGVPVPEAPLVPVPTAAADLAMWLPCRLRAVVDRQQRALVDRLAITHDADQLVIIAPTHNDLAQLAGVIRRELAAADIAVPCRFVVRARVPCATAPPTEPAQPPRAGADPRERAPPKRLT